MKRWHILTGISAIAVAVVGMSLANVFPSEIAPISQVDQVDLDRDLIEIGKNLALLGDCSSCHTPTGAEGLSGGFAIPTPFGTIYSTNITPDLETGIGTWSFAAFDRAMRKGIDRAGNHLYPAFPYDHFASMTDEDMRALYAFVMSEPPVSADRKQNELPFPFSFRPILAGWKLLFHHPKPFETDPQLDDEQNRGKYIAETIGHCGACHTPRNVLGAVKRSQALEGGEAEGWLVPPLGAASIAPAAWTLDDYADYLFDGWSEHHAIAAGPMTSVVDHLYNADEDDVFAIAAWLAAVTPEDDEANRNEIIAKISARDLPETFDFSLAGLEAPAEVKAGALVFRDNCLKCHKERISNSQPISLGFTFAANAAEPTNLLLAVSQGIEPPLGVPSRKMQAVNIPADDMASVAAFVRWQFTDQPSWGNLLEYAESTLEAKVDH